jgi:hypothetical protein
MYCVQVLLLLVLSPVLLLPALSPALVLSPMLLLPALVLVSSPALHCRPFGTP